MFKLNCPNCHRIVRLRDERAEFLHETPCPVCGKILQPRVKAAKQAVPAGAPPATSPPATAAGDQVEASTASSSPPATRRRPRNGGVA